MSTNSDGGEEGMGGVTLLSISQTNGYTVWPNTEQSEINGSHVDNATNITLHLKPEFTLVEQVVFGTWLSISMFLAIIGNFMVIAVVWRHRGMRTRTNMFLVSLAIADFLVGILLAPFSVATLIAQDWLLGDFLCTVNSFLIAVCFITSIQTLMYISIHKYLSITRPLTRMTKCKILIMIVAAWSWAIVCGALTTVILSHAEHKAGTMQCGPAYPEISTKSLIFHFIIQFSNILLPLGIMIFAYARMFKEIKEHMQRLDENTALDREQIYGQQRRVTITLFIVLACFVLCWIPYCVYANYVTFEQDKTKFQPYLNATAYCFGYMNSACNPIIYAWRSPSFREGYKEILCQEPSYVVSDDTMHDSSPNPLRRFSTYISSKRGSRHNSRRGSEESVHSTTKTNVRQVSYASTYKLLHKLTSRTKSGSSVIKRDGSVILVKNGKIISMKLDTSIKKQDMDDVFLTSPSSASSKVMSPGFSKPPDLSVLYENHKQDDDQCITPDSPVNGLTTMCNSISDTEGSEKHTSVASDSDDIFFRKTSSNEPNGRCVKHSPDRDGDNKNTQVQINSLPAAINQNMQNSYTPSPISDQKSEHSREECQLSLDLHHASPSDHNETHLVPPVWKKGHAHKKSDTSIPLRRINTTSGKKFARSFDDLRSSTVPLLRSPSSEHSDCESPHKPSRMEFPCIRKNEGQNSIDLELSQNGGHSAEIFLNNSDNSKMHHLVKNSADQADEIS